jgi:hypothetical protein
MTAGLTAAHVGIGHVLALSRTDLAFRIAENEIDRIERIAAERRVPAAFLSYMAAYETLCQGLSRPVLEAVIDEEKAALRRPSAGDAPEIAEALYAVLPGEEGRLIPILPPMIGKAVILRVLGRLTGEGQCAAVSRAAQHARERVAATVVHLVQDYVQAGHSTPLAWLDDLIQKHAADHEALMNLSHYQSLDPDMDRGDGQKRRKACRKPLPANDQAAVLFLKPGKRTLCLEAGDIHLDGAAPRFLGLPDAFWDLRPNAAFAQLQAQCFGVIALVGRQYPGTFARTPRLASPQADGVQQREHLGPLIAIGGCCAIGQGHASRVGEAVNEDPLAFASTSHTLTAAFARGKTSHPRLRTATESSRVPRRSPGAGLASLRACHRFATAAATDGPHSWTPIGGHVGGRTSDSR